MRCIIRDVILIENFEKWSDWSAVDMAKNWQAQKKLS